MNTYIVKLKQVAVMTGIALGGIGSSGAFTPTNALTFTFTPATGTSTEAIGGFNAAGALWSSVFTDNVNVNINIDFAPLGAGVLAQASSVRQNFSYGSVYSALNLDRTSADDNAVVASLPSSSAFKVLINRTSNNPNGSGNATPYLDSNTDANNTFLQISRANAKALGLTASDASVPIASSNIVVAGSGGGNTPEAMLNAQAKAAVLSAIGSPDATITFSNSFTYDFNRNDGIITAGTFDFVGLAAHEIGHALGFTSGVDVLDSNSPPVNGPFRDDQFTFVNTLDLFRYSTQSSAVGAIDWTADTRDKYFSLNGGVANIALFSNGQNFGDGRQASHWKDSLGLGIMDPTAAPGELLAISENDKRAFDAIGWNRADAITAVPEPADFVGTFIFATFTAKLVLKRRKQMLKLTEKSAWK
jgi:hypothetical protein